MCFFSLGIFVHFIYLFWRVCGGTLLLFVQHSLIHSHNFFCVSGGSVSVGQCAFLFWGNNK